MESTAQPDSNPKRRALGRGLAALIPGPAPTAASATASGLRHLPIERIQPNPAQPRKQFDEAGLKELADSIRKHGILQPVVVRRRAQGYELVAGERRWRAAARAGLQEVPALVKELSDASTLQLALIENIQRQDLDPLEEAEAYARLVRDHGLTHDALAAAMGKSRPSITNSLRLLKLPEHLIALLAQGQISPGHARALMALPDARSMDALAKDIVGRHLSVRDAEAQVQAQLRARRRPAAGGAQPAGARATPAEAAVEDRLRRALSVKVRLQQRQGRGHIELHFTSLDELDALLDRLLPA